jgi:RHS repeat-associated protein
MASLVECAVIMHDRANIWDSQNRLRQCVYGGTVSQFTYGSDGLRRTSNVNGTIRKYMLDNGMMVRETDGNGVSQATYLAGLRGPEYRRDDVNGTIKWYVGACPEVGRDGLGSVLAEMDGSNGTLTASRKLDVYGAPRATQGTPSSKHAFVGNLGHTTEPDTGGLVYMRARWMDPVTGTFLSEDPARDGANWFGSCGGDPVNRVDADGRTAVSVLAVVLNLAGSLVGFCLSYWTFARAIEAANPGYTSSFRPLGLAMPVAQAVGTAIADLDGDPMATRSIADWAKHIRIGLARGAGGVALLTFRSQVGFVVGTIFGALQAVYEYLSSDYYAR